MLAPLSSALVTAVGLSVVAGSGCEASSSGLVSNVADGGRAVENATVVYKVETFSPLDLAMLPVPFTGRNVTDQYIPSPSASTAPSATSSSLPTSSAAFQVFHPSLHSLLGDSPSLTLITRNDSYDFAHEAAAYFSDTDEIYWSSNAGSPKGMSDLNRNNKIFKAKVEDIEMGGKSWAETVQEVVTDTDQVQMVNGGTPYRSNYLVATEGRGPSLPGGLAIVPREDPKKAHTILNNYLGRQFNAPNDLVVHPKSGAIFWTDADYGFTQNFRPPSTLPKQVYRFDPSSGILTVLTDDVVTPNGILLSPDGKKAYVADTGATIGNGTWIPTNPATIYVFDVETIGSGSLSTEIFTNRRVFAHVDTGVPDGLKADVQGNVYAGCGDGVHVFSPEGILLGKVFLGTTVANLAFAGKGRLVILGETTLWLAKGSWEGVALDKIDA